MMLVTLELKMNRPYAITAACAAPLNAAAQQRQAQTEDQTVSY
jgi:hypothetical protein